MGTATPASALGGYSKAEEIANAVTHGIAALLSLVGLGVLVYCAAVGSGRAGVIAAAAVFGTAMVFLYTASTLYHAVPNRRAKRILQMLDHGAIYVMIAGSYTPFCLITLRGTTGTVLCAAVWTIAVLGAVLQPVLLRRAEWLNCLPYLLLGWCVVLVMKPLAAALPAAGLWLLAGGYEKSTPAAIVYKASWEDEQKYVCTVETLARTAQEHGITKTALIIVGDVVSQSSYSRSKLYDPTFTTEFREGTS